MSPIWAVAWWGEQLAVGEPGRRRGPSPRARGRRKLIEVVLPRDLAPAGTAVRPEHLHRAAECRTQCGADLHHGAHTAHGTARADGQGGASIVTTATFGLILPPRCATAVITSGTLCTRASLAN